MKNSDTMKRTHGVLTLRAYDAEGVEVWRVTESNHIVSEGYKIAAQALAGVEGARIARVACGTSGIEPQDGDTAITAPVFVDITSVEYPEPSTVRFNFTFDYATAAGMAICEFGLYTADDRLFSRKVRQPIEKTEYMSIVGVWDINF